MILKTMSDKEFLSASWPKTIPYFARMGEITSISNGSHSVKITSATKGSIIQPNKIPENTWTTLQESKSESLRLR